MGLQILYEAIVKQPIYLVIETQNPECECVRDFTFYLLRFYNKCWGKRADSLLLSKSKAFALEIIKTCNEVKSTKREFILTNQRIRSGTSIGANIREAFCGHSRADFIAKLQIALKDCSESDYWLELLIESGYYSNKTVLAYCTELKRLLVASLNTAKSKG